VASREGSRAELSASFKGKAAWPRIARGSL
jgi:hypothetical protein